MSDLADTLHAFGRLFDRLGIPARETPRLAPVAMMALRRHRTWSTT